MAGSHIGWRKLTKGPYKGQKVFISKAVARNHGSFWGQPTPTTLEGQIANVIEKLESPNVDAWLAKDIKATSPRKIAKKGGAALSVSALSAGGTTQQIVIAGKPVGKKKIVKATVTALVKDGLGVHRSDAFAKATDTGPMYNADKRWMITQVSSGQSLGEFPSEMQALQAQNALIKLGIDWPTISGTTDDKITYGSKIAQAQLIMSWFKSHSQPLPQELQP